MKHYFRLISIFLSRMWRAEVHFLDTTDVYFRVWPTDLDLLMHMNNGVYLSLMDLGRMDLTLRSGFYAVLKKNNIYPVLGSEVIRFRKSLKPFQKFRIETRLWNWDDKYFYLRQQFKVRDDVYASALVKARFLTQQGGKVSPEEIFKLLVIDPEQTRLKFKPSHEDLEAYKKAESLLLS